MSDFWLGVLATLATIAGIALVIGAVWLVLILYPEIQWATVKRLPMQDVDARNRAAATIGSARRAITLRIPVGIRLTLSLGEHRDRHKLIYRALDDSRWDKSSDREVAP